MTSPNAPYLDNIELAYFLARRESGESVLAACAPRDGHVWVFSLDANGNVTPGYTDTPVSEGQYLLRQGCQVVTDVVEPEEFRDGVFFDILSNPTEPTTPLVNPLAQSNA